MKSIEKPFEYLDEKEKQILALCQEIILWGTKPENVRNLRSLYLKEKATDLYNHLNNIDFSNDDKYYKLYEEYDKLKDEFDKIKYDEHINIEMKENPEGFLAKIKSDFESGNNIILNKEYETNQQAYGVYLDIAINQFNNEIELKIQEMYDSFTYESNLIDKIKKVFEQFKIEYDFNEHEHSSIAIEYNLSCKVKKFEELEKLLLSIFKITEEKRIIKKH